MAEPVLIDVDVALKVCSWQSEAPLLARTTRTCPPAMLSIGSYTLRSRVAKPRHIRDIEGTRNSVARLLSEVLLIQPTDQEIALAAEFEEAATTQALELDTGESQLMAVLVRRAAPLFLTGDKRAVQAISQIAPDQCEGKIACLEQVMFCLTQSIAIDHLRDSVCSEPEVDRAITACFACSANGAGVDDIRAGLASYSRHLRGVVGSVLLSSDDLSAVIP